jgi:ketosteroid isomerase-like protein
MRGVRGAVGGRPAYHEFVTKRPIESASENVETARALYCAVERKDRAAAERLIAEDFRFFSPLDNGLDRQKYFEICWPESQRFEEFKLTDAVADGERVFVTYETLTRQGERFRNAEVLTVRDGRISAVEVYFGWNIPHPVAAGEHDSKAA